MNRAFTVWLDLSAKSASAPSAAPLPSFTLSSTAFNDAFGLGAEGAGSGPLSRREVLERILRFVWSRRGTIVGLVLLWKLLGRLRAWSRSTHSATALSGPLDVSLFPQYIVSPSTGLWLYTRSWRVVSSRERGLVFIVHGYREHIGRYEPLVAALNAAGFSVHAMDLPGQGQSGGDRGYIESFSHYAADYAHFIRHTQGQITEGGGKVKPCFVFGHSMGATIALQMARVEEWRVAAEEEDMEQAQAAAQAEQERKGRFQHHHHHIHHSQHPHSQSQPHSLQHQQQQQQQPHHPPLRSPPPPVAHGHEVLAIAEEGNEEAWSDPEEDKRSDSGSSSLVRSIHSSSNNSSSSVSPPDGPSSSSSASSFAASAASSGSLAASSSSASSASPHWRLSGLLLSSPALIPHAHSVSPLLQTLASLLADVLPKARPAPRVLLDASALSGLTAVNAQWTSDALTCKAAIPARWGREMLDAMADVRGAATLGEITVPTLILQGTRDQLVSPQGASFALQHLTACKDKTLRWYEAAHDLYLDTVREQFTKDVIAWLQQHTNEPQQ